MSVLSAIFIAQLLDPVRVVLSFVATFWAIRSAPSGKRFTPLSLAIIGVTAVVSFFLSMMTAEANANMAATSFAIGLCSTGVLVGVSVLVLSNLFRL